MPSAALVVIGNEILAGKFRDRNTPWLIDRCRELGIDLLRVAILPDDVKAIANELRSISPAVDHVFTTGGVGPTHDDVTMAGVAEAFSVPLVRHERLAALLREKLGSRFTEAALAMADIPEGAELWWDGDFILPLVVMRNVCIFPGVPELLQRKFDDVSGRFQGAPRYGRRLVTSASEPAIADLLRAVQARWPMVSIGSYPQFSQRPWTVTVTVDGRDPAAVDGCMAELTEALAGSLVE